MPDIQPEAEHQQVAIVIPTPRKLKAIMRVSKAAPKPVASRLSRPKAKPKARRKPVDSDGDFGSGGDSEGASSVSVHDDESDDNY